jgi:prepilin-type N-terminal cleavage/methylation domain-containing protein
MICRKDKYCLCNNQKGFSLIEVMVALGMLGIISLGTMQLMTNMTKGQKGMTFKSNIDQIVNEVKMAMRVEANCTETLAGLSPNGSPQDVNDNEIKKDCNSDTPIVCNVVISGVPGANKNVIGIGSGANVTITSITHTGDAFGGDETKSGTINISMQLTDSDGVPLDSNKIFGASTITRTITTSYNNGGSGADITKCTGDSTTYAKIACDKVGGTFLGDNGPCTAVKITGYSGVTPTPYDPSNPPDTLPDPDDTNLKSIELDEISITAYNHLYVKGGSAIIERNLFVGLANDYTPFSQDDDNDNKYHIFTKGGILSEGNIYANASINVEEVLNIEGAIVFNEDKSSMLYNSTGSILLVGSDFGTASPYDIHSGNDIYSSKNIYAHDGQIETSSYHISSGGNETEVISNDMEITGRNINLLGTDAGGASIQATGDIKTDGNIYLAGQSDDGSLQEVATKAYVNKLLFTEMTDAEKQQVIAQMLLMFEDSGMQDIYIYFKQKLAEADTKLNSGSGDPGQAGCISGEKIQNIFWESNGGTPAEYSLIIECIAADTEAQEILSFLYASCDDVTGQEFIRLQRTACPCSDPDWGGTGGADYDLGYDWDQSSEPFKPVFEVLKAQWSTTPAQPTLIGDWEQDSGESCNSKLGKIPPCYEVTVGGICEGDSQCAGDTSGAASNCNAFDVYVRIR